MSILVVYASRHGATQGIAEHLAASLRARHLDVALRPVKGAGDPAGFEAVIVGSAAYTMHWLGDATAFVRDHKATLADRPVWLFSSGPLGTETVDAKGRDVLATAEPREFAEFRETIRPRGTMIFFGAWDAKAKPIGLAERAMALLPAARNAMPTGDFRDWSAIDAWAGSIADELAHSPVGAH